MARRASPLGLAAGEGRRGLAELDVAEPDPGERGEQLADAGDRLQLPERLSHREIEDVGDGEASVLHLEGLAVVTLAPARLALDEHVGEEVHLDSEHPVALAGLASAALDVERETPRFVAARARVRERREELAEEGERARVSGRVRSRRPPDGGLIDADDLVDVLEPHDGVARSVMLVDD